MIEFSIDQEHQLLASLGLTHYESFMEYASGKAISQSRCTDVIQIEFSDHRPNGVLYLKRTFSEPFSISFRNLLKGAIPHCDAYREKLLIKSLMENNIRVMKLLAWGEEKKLGVPISGFIVVEGVHGERCQSIFTSDNDERKQQLIAAYGQLTAQLNSLGFFQPIRLKDLICTSLQNISAKDLVLIDRSFSWPYQQKFSPNKCQEALVRAFRRMSRYTHFNNEDLNQFSESYCQGIQSHWATNKEKIYSILLKTLK